jgi:alkanesulfonate monooxygenase SsuD/methylene tetrahydromethanopterin reductase-like flavin-dependent oxidoreductase (luciferase family)
MVPGQHASTRIKRSVPSTRVLNAVNPFVVALLRSPLHGVLSKQVMLLTFTGRKSGKTFTIPVEYCQEGSLLTIWSGHRWPANLRGGAPVAIRLRGRQRTAWADAIDDPDELLAEVDRYVARYGRKGAGLRIGVVLDVQPPLSREELAGTLQGRVVIRLTLDREHERSMT